MIYEHDNLIDRDANEQNNREIVTGCKQQPHDQIGIRNYCQYSDYKGYSEIFRAHIFPFFDKGKCV